MEKLKITLEKVDRKSPEILEAISNAPLFKKQGKVQARPAVEGEIITTKLVSGAE